MPGHQSRQGHHEDPQGSAKPSERPLLVDAVQTMLTLATKPHDGSKRPACAGRRIAAFRPGEMSAGKAGEAQDRDEKKERRIGRDHRVEGEPSTA